MDALYDLKDLLVKELENYGKKGEMSAAVLERVDMLAHATKNLDKVIECYEPEGEYSGARVYHDNVYNEGRSYGTGRSFARGRGSNTRRDSMGRYASDGYSRNSDLADRLRGMMDDAPDDRTRQEIQRLVNRMDQM